MQHLITQEIRNFHTVLPRQRHTDQPRQKKANCRETVRPRVCPLFHQIATTYVHSRQLKRKAETWVDPSSKFSRRVTVCNLKGREGKIDKKKKKEKRMEKRRIRNGEMEVIRLVTYRNFIIIMCDSRFSFNCQKLYTTSVKSRALC